MFDDLAGKTIAVTGGAGHLGTAICNGLYVLGADVISLSSRPCKFPGRSVVCDLAVEQNVVDALAGERLDGMVNCAGRVPRGLAAGSTKEAMTEALSATVSLYVYCIGAALRTMKSPGSIVNVASMWGAVAPDLSNYLDLKNEPSLSAPACAGAIMSVTRYLALIAAKQSVRVNVLVPGWFPKPGPVERPDYIAKISERVLLGRIGQPHELVGPAAFLLSEASSYMTGQQLIVDGGYTVQ